MKFAFIKEHLMSFPIDVICQVLDVSRSGYYAWLKRPQSARAQRRQELAERIWQVHEDSDRIYGSPRVWQALRARGHRVSHNTVADIMKERELRAKTRKRFIPSTTDSRHHQPVAGAERGTSLIDRRE